jgi:hypothetical protein
MRPMRKRILALAATVLAGGSLLQIGTCTPNNILSYVRGLNPCGSLLACDPVTYTFLTSGYQGPGIDADIDPACVYPPYCPGDPFVSTGTTTP